MEKRLASIPLDQRYFEDYVPGEVVDCGSVAIREEEILEFGRRYDPQPFHTDPVAAGKGPFGGVIASGWHTAVLMMPLFVRGYISSVASLGAPEANELKWPRPVRGGDVLRVRVTVLDSRRSRSKPDRGLVRSLVEVFNHHHELVMSIQVLNFLTCRNISAA